MSVSSNGKRIHFLTQFVWPDGCPTGLYVELVAEDLTRKGWPVQLVGGTGKYRHSPRPSPNVPISKLKHWKGKRGNLVSVASEYLTVFFAFKNYIEDHVNCDDIVVVTTAPPSSVMLASAIRKKCATAIYWIHDYYPELVRSLWDYPARLRELIYPQWDEEISKWDHIVKIAGNLGYDGPNLSVIRDWPTLELGKELPAIPKTALYCGNFGYIHHIPSFLRECEKLADDGYTITICGDGPGIKQLPSWIKIAPPWKDVDELRRLYWEAEVHLIAGHPKIGRAIFPSKIYNCLATGRKIICTGFSEKMSEEFETVKRLDYRTFLPEWEKLIQKFWN